MLATLEKPQPILGLTSNALAILLVCEMEVLAVTTTSIDPSLTASLEPEVTDSLAVLVVQEALPLPKDDNDSSISNLNF